MLQKINKCYTYAGAPAHTRGRVQGGAFLGGCNFVTDFHNSLIINGYRCYKACNSKFEILRNCLTLNNLRCYRVL